MPASSPPREPRVSGAVILDQLRVVADLHGEGVLKRARESLPREMQDELASMLAISWIESRTAMEFKNAIAREIGRDPIDFQKWVVKTAVLRTIHQVWRALLARVKDGALVQRAPLLYSKTFDRGRLVVVKNDDTSTELLVTGWHSMPDYDCIGLSSGIEAVLE
ncbi:MAG: hypothetical protein ACRELY_30560, partial [Polyangiaceae bacterium]